MCKPVLSICIVTYKVHDLLSDCLRSIYQNPPDLPFEIIIVDNHSQDGTIELLQKEFPLVRYIENQKNEGYTLPMNAALKMGSGQYLVQLNPDTLVVPGAFDRLVCFMEEHPQAGICTPKVLNRDGTLQKQCRRSAGRPWDAFTYFSGLSRRYPDNPRFAGYLMTYLDDHAVNEVEAVSGSCMVIRRELVEKIGYLDELFFAYQEDTDFCFRAREAGWKIYYVPDAQIYHFGGEGGSGVEVYRSIYQWHRSYFLYFRKHMARDYFFLFNWLIYLLIAVKLALTIVFTLLRKKKYAGTKKP
ncbi:MAG: glycosyltransferase family 2 protein [Anaerolineaceae bacterium]|nr:glycosyltransferase family 2 protein [Anaerolineaceae bacterium]